MSTASMSRLDPPPAYIAGLVIVPGGQVFNLLDLIRQQLATNCPATCHELTLQADAGNTGAIRIGAASRLSGPLSATNYAYALTATSPPKTYTSAYPGYQAPVGDLQVICTSGCNLRVELVI